MGRHTAGLDRPSGDVRPEGWDEFKMAAARARALGQRASLMSFVTS